MKLGYARVSTGEQDLSGQLEALQAAGCQRVYSEKKSGGNDNRAALPRMLKELQPVTFGWVEISHLRVEAASGTARSSLETGRIWLAPPSTSLYGLTIAPHASQHGC